MGHTAPIRTHQALSRNRGLYKRLNPCVDILIPSPCTMGQYWRIVAPFIRQDLGAYGNLGSFFFSSNADYLASLLRRPTCDPTVSAEVILPITPSERQISFRSDYYAA